MVNRTFSESIRKAQGLMEGLGFEGYLASAPEGYPYINNVGDYPGEWVWVREWVDMSNAGIFGRFFKVRIKQIRA